MGNSVSLPDILLLDGQIMDDYTIQWNGRIYSNVSIPLCAKSSDEMIEFPIPIVENDIITTSLIKVTFSIPVSELKITESMRDNVRYITIKKRIADKTTLFQKIMGTKYHSITGFRMSQSNKVDQRLPAVNCLCLNVSLTEGEMQYSRKNVMMIGGLMAMGVVCMSTALYCLYQIMV